MSYEVSRLRPSDAEVLGPLHHRIWRTAYADLLPPGLLAAGDDVANTRQWRARGLAHDRSGHSPEGCTTWVARTEQGLPVGWIGVGPARDADAPAAVELWSLYVAPEQQRRGLARQLVDDFLPPGAAYLWVLAGNDPAIAFYRRVGFVPDGATQPFSDTGALELRMLRQRVSAAPARPRPRRP